VALKQNTFQMVTRVQLDASHVSRGVTENAQVYKELLTDSEVRAFRTLLYSLRTLEYAERDFARFLKI